MENFQKCFQPFSCATILLTEMFLKSIICNKLKIYLNRTKNYYDIKMAPKYLLSHFFINSV